MQYSVEDRIFVNDAGNQIKYKRLVIQGFLNGQLHEMELPISKDQATIYELMKNASRPEITSRSGGEVNTTRKTSEDTSMEEKSWLED